MAGYDAITFDTQTVISNGFAFNSGLLQSLKSLKDTPVRVVITDVVRNELIKHTTRFYQDLINKNNDSNRKNHEHGLIENIPDKIVQHKEANEFAIKKIDEYLAALGCATIDINAISLVEVMDRYFKSEPPFSKSGDKKNEFPDAVSLLALQHFATANSYRILAISGDKDWQRFADDVQYLDLVKEVSDGLDLINKHREDAYKVVEAIMAPVFKGDAEEIYSQMDDRLSDAILREFPYITADSSFYFEANDLTLEYNSFNLIDDNFKILEISNNLEYFQIEVEAIVFYTATASFSFSVIDSFDKDYHVISDDEYSVDSSSNVKLLISFFIIDGTMHIEGIDITKFPSTIHFDNVEPDFN